MTEYWVEYEFVNTPWGMRPMFMRIFKTMAEAVQFSEAVRDAKIVGANPAERV